MKLTLGLYGVFLLMVAIQGNAGTLTSDLKSDMPNFLPWLIVAAVLGALYDHETTHAFGVAVIILVVFAFVLKNYGNLETQGRAIYSSMTGGGAAALRSTGS